MKKLKFISAIALTVLMASCDDFDLPNPPGQTNGEPTGIFEAGDMAITPATEAIDLKACNAANQNAVVGTISQLTNFPEDYELAVEMEISGQDNFGTFATISTIVTDNVITVNPDAFNGAIRKAISKAPATYDVYARFVGYAVKGNTKLRLGGLTQTYGQEMLKVTTLDPDIVIEDNYYLVPCAANGTPDFGKAIKMNNTSGAGVNPYDNPEWAIKIDVTEELATTTGYLWKVAPASAITSGAADALFGCVASPESDLTGKLTVGAPSGAIMLQGPVLITVNMEVSSYSISYAFDALYPLSGSTLTKPENACLLYTTNYINYQGVSVLNGVYYICGQPNYRVGTVFKQDNELGFEDSEDGLTRTGYLTPASDGGQLRTPVSKAHLYWMDVNLVQQTYAITCLETLSVIGSGNGWDLATATPLTPNKDMNVWTAENVHVGDNFKINANGAWNIDFGGVKLQDVNGKHVYNMSYKGSNCEAPEGDYKVTIDFRSYPYVLTLE